MFQTGSLIICRTGLIVRAGQLISKISMQLIAKGYGQRES